MASARNSTASFTDLRLSAGKKESLGTGRLHRLIAVLRIFKLYLLALCRNCGNTFYRDSIPYSLLRTRKSTSAPS